uniref:alpha/beta fold hydrolase n=1 Tax=Methylobacterium sp. B34 TaxID=95563 RepID=UPI0005B25A6A
MGDRPAYIAVDWGTTNRRAFAVSEAGVILDSLHDERGVLALSPDAYPAEIAALRARLGADLIVAVGMIGSNRGWQAAPYVAAPATLTALADGITLAYDSFGDGAAETILLIAGLGTQMIRWTDAFCLELVTRGFRVVRFDNRDTGRSTHFAEHGAMDFATLASALTEG